MPAGGAISGRATKDPASFDMESPVKTKVKVRPRSETLKSSLVKIPLEADIEAAFIKGLKTLGVNLLVRKMNGIGYRSWPDRLILGPNGFVMWVELKRPKIGKLSPGQKDLFETMESLGHCVNVFVDAKVAVMAVKAALINHGVLRDG
jgi:hypothetical protein